MSQPTFSQTAPHAACNAFVQETVYHVEMLRPDELRPAKPAAVAWELRRAEVPCPELSRFFYTEVGADWKWTDRLDWTYAQWLSWVQGPGYEMWIPYVQGTPAGYFELAGPAGADVEIVFFGLLPQFRRRGIGGDMLTRAVERAWAKPARRVWLHTCSFDDPAALPNYQARGFRLFKTEVHQKAARARGRFDGA
jgi:GNAT superfamily N-acetyltransferase